MATALIPTTARWTNLRPRVHRATTLCRRSDVSSRLTVFRASPLTCGRRRSTTPPMESTSFPGAAFPQDPGNLPAERGPSLFDTRNRFTAAVNYDVPAWKAARGLWRGLAVEHDHHVFRAVVRSRLPIRRHQRPVLFQSTAQRRARRESHSAPLDSEHWLSQSACLRAAGLRDLRRSGSRLDLWPGTIATWISPSRKNTRLDRTAEPAIARRVLQYVQPSEFRLAGAQHHPGICRQRKSRAVRRSRRIPPPM